MRDFEEDTCEGQQQISQTCVVCAMCSNIYPRMLLWCMVLLCTSCCYTQSECCWSNTFLLWSNIFCCCWLCNQCVSCIRISKGVLDAPCWHTPTHHHKRKTYETHAMKKITSCTVFMRLTAAPHPPPHHHHLHYYCQSLSPYHHHHRQAATQVEQPGPLVKGPEARGALLKGKGVLQLEACVP